MACGVTVAYTEALLGPPAFRRTNSDTVELTWRLPHAWFCALTRHDSIASFAITVTDPKFRYDCTHLTFGHLTVTLGHDNLDAAPQPQATHVSIGARRYQAVDEHYFGNPGAYQQYALAHNDHGIGTISTDTPDPHDPASTDPTRTARFRAETTANTLIVASPLDDHTWHLWDFPGVDKDFVRTLRTAE